VYIATIDCGTTHSRVYIVDKMGAVVGKARAKVGVRDTAITGSRETLKNGLKSCFADALEDAGLNSGQIGIALAAGMITSEIGLVEIPHLWAPAGIADLAAGMVEVRESEVFPSGVPLYYIPGIRNRFNPETVTPEEVGKLDFMRGEEVQVAGLLELGLLPPLGVTAILSSHTKFIPVGADARIEGSVTTLSGQIYEAVQTQTFIGKSTRPDSEEDESRFADYWDAAVVDNAADWVRRTGISRTFLMTRFLDVLLHRPWYERRLFVEGAIAAEDLNALGQVSEIAGGGEFRNLLLVGAPRRARIYHHLIRANRPEIAISSVSDPEEIDLLSIRGVRAIASARGLIAKDKAQ